MSCGGCPKCPTHGKECITTKAHGDRPPLCLHPIQGKLWCRWTIPTDGDRCPVHSVPFHRKGAAGFLCSYDCPHWREK